MRGLFLILFLLFSGTALPQITSCGIGKPFTRDYSLTENNIGVKVNGLAQDANGYIWIATDRGLFRYNGRNFVKAEDSIRRPATAIAVSGERIWVGYDNGKIGHVEDMFVRPLTIANGPTSAITSLTQAGLDLLVASTEEEGVFVLPGDAAIAVNTAKGLSDNFTYGVALGDSLSMIAGTDLGINDIELAGSKLQIKHSTTAQGLPDNIVTVIQNIPGSKKCLVGTQEGGVVFYNRESKLPESLNPGVAHWIYGQVNDILPVSETRAWVATESGYLVEMTMNKGTTELKPYQYPGKCFRKLLLDKAGNIWCGTTHGLTLMTGEYLSNIKLEAPYSLYDATSMAWSDGALLIALRRDLYKVQLCDSVPKMSHLFTAGAPISSLYIDKYSHLWIGTMGDGLYHQENGASIIKVKGLDEVGDKANILSIASGEDAIWVAGLKGVDELSYPASGKITLVKHHGKKTGIGSDYVYQLYPDSKGHIWMATDGAGVCMYDGSNYRHWNSSFEQGGKVAYSVTEDTAGDMWAATMYKDLYHLHGGKWENLRLPETQYPDINISAVMANATGQVISVYQRCFDEWYPRSHYFRHYNSALGIGIDSTSNVLNCIAKDSAGNVYVPYQHGIAVFKNQEEIFDIRPDVHIVHPTVYSKSVADGKHRFDYDENYLGFTFDGISFANHERLNFRYQLQGYNDEWINTRDASVSFPKLSPGAYKFRVQVSLNPAFQHPNEDDYAFVIATPFWKTPWFYVLAIAFVLLLVYLYVKQREKNLKHLSQLQQERMMFEYEHLKSQINPHFLFNSLYALSILIEEKRENAVDYTTNLADLYRNMLTHSKQDLISLKEEFDILRSYILIQQTRFGEALQVRIDVAEELMETKKIVPLAMQLLVENAIKHNVVSIAQPLVIYISATEDEITVRNFIQPKISKEKGAGIGLINIRQRYRLLTNKRVVYGVFENEFIVKLPLL